MKKKFPLLLALAALGLAACGGNGESSSITSSEDSSSEEPTSSSVPSSDPSSSEVPSSSDPSSSDPSSSDPSSSSEPDPEPVAHALGATYSIANVAEMYFYEQDAFDPDSAPWITEAKTNASIYCYLAFNDGYSHKEYNITVKNGETVLPHDEALLASNGEYVYHFTMPNADVTLDVTLVDKNLDWDYYFADADTSLETTYPVALSIAEIKQYVPFIRPGLYDFDYVYGDPYESDSGTTLFWMLMDDAKFASSAEAYEESDTMKMAMENVLTTDAGWAYDSYYGCFYKAATEDLQVQVYHTYEENDDGTYSAGIYFSAYRYVAPTSWISAFETIDSYYSMYESYYDFILTAEEIEANVPFFTWRFDGLEFANSLFNNNYAAWAFIQYPEATDATGMAEEAAAIDAAAAEVLTTEAGWTKGTIAEGITGYSKEIEGKVIHAYTTVYSNGYGESYPALIFDGEIVHASWGSFLSNYISMEDSYYFSAYSADIDREFPYWKSEYAEAVNYFDSAVTLYDAAWAIGVEGLTEAAQTTAIDAMEAEMATQLAAAGWTEDGVYFEDANHNAYCKVSETDGNTYYMYVRGFSYEDYYTGATAYGAYFVFDCLVPNWINYFAGDVSWEAETSFAMPLSTIRTLVPWWESACADNFWTSIVDSQFTESYSAWAIGLSDERTEAARDEATATLEAELAANLTAATGWELVTIGEGDTAFDAYSYYDAHYYTTYYIYILEGSDYEGDGVTQTFSTRIIFDAEVTWGSLYVDGYSRNYPNSVIEYFERSSTFCVPFATILENVPFLARIGWSGLDYQESTRNEAEYVWFAIYETTATTIDTAKAEILAEMKYVLTDFAYDSTTGEFTKALSETETLVLTFEANSDSTALHLVFDVNKTPATPSV